MLERIHLAFDSALVLLRQLVLVVDATGHLLQRNSDLLIEVRDFRPIFGEIL